MIDLKDHIRTIPDFPKPGIMFRDVTPLFAHVAAFDAACRQLAAAFQAVGVDIIAGIEARGFVLGGAIARELGVGFAPVRKQGKLPWTTISADYELEYGSATLEMHVDAVERGARVGVVDDLIATGGTGLAAMELVDQLGGLSVAFGAIIDLPELGGREKIAAAGADAQVLISYDGH